jgi:hypothetical protein
VGRLQAKTLRSPISKPADDARARRDQDRWMADAKLMLDAGMAAYRRHEKDVAALVELNDAVYRRASSAQHYRRNYGRGRGQP